MKTVRLYGHLATGMGKEFQFDIKTPGEALRALKANFKNFSECVKQNELYTILIDKESMEPDKWGNPISDREVIKIVPIYQGAGRNFLKSALTIVVGAALIYFSAGAASGLVGTSGTFLGATSAQLASTFVSIGVGLVVSGLSSLLFAPPSFKSDDTEDANNIPNFAFSGAVNTTQQGNPVPVGYGQLVVGSQVISAGLRVEDRGSTDTPTLSAL
jgi:predicted phage tail protein